jgi:uncharacterized lipoprotein YddW (UPF0748 family)
VRTPFSPLNWSCVLLTLVLCAALAPARPSAAAPPATDDVRALWVTRATMTSGEAITRLVLSAKAGGFNTLLVQVRGRGDAYYRSTLEPRAAELAGRPDFDPLAQVIAEAHDAGLTVHAWVAVNLVSSAATLPASRDHIVHRHPEWLMVPKALAAELRTIDVRSPEYVGRLARWSRARNTEVEGLYVSPVHPAAATHVVAVVKDLVTRYPLDGLHLDYVRYPGHDFDYGRASIQEFVTAVQPELTAAEQRQLAARARIDPLAYPNGLADRWNAFRRSRLTALVMRIRTAVKAARPETLVSAAVIPDATEAYTSRLQDWRTWVDQSLIDVLCPMAYTMDPRTFDAQITTAQSFAAGRPVWAGIGAYRLSADETVRFIQASRRLGTAGVVLFSYEALMTPPHTAASLTTIGKAAFGTGSR